MNTNALKNFAQEARRKLLEQVGSRLEFVLNTDSPALREKAEQVNKLREVIKDSSKEQIIDKVAYIWFNRFIALRFMDANDYQPVGIRVITPKDGYTLPELLDEAKQGIIPSELAVKNQRIFDLLDGKIPSSNGQNEAFKELLIGACNHLNKVFPFLFERINDYTELLLPDDLTSGLSILQDIINGMTIEDCKEVEIIGWLYQFYISEKKDELINAKRVYKADEIAPVTQLFTPRWIVEFMVDNTLGQFWKEARPTSEICSGLHYYIKPNNPELIPRRAVKSIEDIKFFDPCVGSAHVLCYAFEIFYKIYEEEGYNPTDIPVLILSKNLFGIDIDERAAQLAGFALMMKGRKYNKRFFKKEIILNVSAFQNISTHPKFVNAKVLGSLIKINQAEADSIVIDETSLFADRDRQLKKQMDLLAGKYDIIVTNPPYLNSSYMEGTLKQFVEKEYNDTKADLFACFLIQVSRLTKNDGIIGFICPYVWMFIQSYEKLRNFIIGNTTISSLVQLEYNAFGPAVVPIGTFVLRNQFISGYEGSYIRLSEFKGEESQSPKTLEAVQNPSCGWFYCANQKVFEIIPGNPIAYWLSSKSLSLFNKKSINNISKQKQGLITADNFRFLRYWHEVNLSSSVLKSSATVGKKKWFGLNKGGDYRKWYGNLVHVVNWYNDGVEIINFVDEKGKQKSRPQNLEYYFKEGVTWTDLTTLGVAARFLPNGFIFDGSGPTAFMDSKYLKYILGLINFKYTSFLSKVLNPTFHFTLSDFGNIPFIYSDNNEIPKLVDTCIDIATNEWNIHEYSWDFQQDELVRIKGQDLEEAFDLYQQSWKNKFMKLHKSEEELNRLFIEIYGLQDELTPDIALEEITLLKEESTIENGELFLDSNNIITQFLSYAVGCMFGRYSLDKAGLILANQGETLENYLEILALNEKELSFKPDEDNIIPVLDDEWFEDGIVGRFNDFLKASFGTANFEKNLAYIEECLGKDIRKYFVKDFYNDHIKRYKKRPIYWMFSSPKGSFNVLIYMHRYNPDTLNKIMNDYLIQFKEKLSTRVEHLDHLIVSGSSGEQTKASKEKDKIKLLLLELQEYEREILRPLAIERIKIDLDDGVLVNYNKFGKAVKEVTGLNDKATKKKVKEFDWINIDDIR